MKRKTVIYDADQAGSFIPLLTPPEGRNRIVLAAASRNRQALVPSGAAISFSTFFWQAGSAGVNVRDAFHNARNALEPFSDGENRTVPQMDDNGDGLPNQRSDGQIAVGHTIGAGMKLLNAPAIADGDAFVELKKGEEICERTISVTGTDKDDDVWAVIIPPRGHSLSEIPEPSVKPERKDGKDDAPDREYKIGCEDCFKDFGTYRGVCQNWIRSHIQSVNSNS